MIKEAVILAAGAGKRMQPLSLSTPKALLPIAGKPNLSYQIETLLDHKIETIYLVIDHKDHQIEPYVTSEFGKYVEIKIIKQKENKGAAEALLLLKDIIHNPFVLFLGDIFFSGCNLEPLIKDVVYKNYDCSLMAIDDESFDSVKKNFVVIPKANNDVAYVIEKPLQNIGLIKGCGLYTFMPNIFKAISNTNISERFEEIGLTDAIQTLIDSNSNVSFHKTIDLEVNLTTPDDLVWANQKFCFSNQIITNDHTELSIS